VAASHGRYLTEHEGCPARKVRVIPNGVDTERFRPRPPDPALRRELGLPLDAPLAGIVAALRPEKNYALLLKAARLVRQRMPGAHFLIVGDGPERRHITEMVRDWGLCDAVRLAGTRHDIPALLSLMDIFVLTSHMEANPVSILEALACEKPVVATAVGSVGETVLDGKTGLLVPPGDAEALAERLIALWSDPGQRTALGRAGRRHVVAQWSLRRMIEGYEDLISGLFTAKTLPRYARVS